MPTSILLCSPSRTLKVGLIELVGVNRLPAGKSHY
jgi:hypothetical protein